MDCPGNEYCQALLDGTMPAQQQEPFEQHLSSCPACQARLDVALSRDAALVQLGRDVGDPTETPTDSTLVQMLEELADVPALGVAARPGAVDLYFLRPAERPGLLGLLGAYEVQEVIGQGGMGIVLKAYEPALQRLVAIKVLAPALAGSATARRRFTREAQAAAAVCHENIVPVYGVHEIDGLPYLVMQYIAGESLQDRLDRLGPLETTELIRIGYQTAGGLAAAHAQGLIHRDIKPANLLLENGMARVKITDFGLARMVDDVQLTQSGMIAGTPEYMAPEQARGEPLDHRIDLFSFGSVLYAMSTGLPPFRGTSAVALLRKVSDHEPAPLRSLNPEVPAWLAELIDRLMVKDRDQRLQSAAEVADLLQGYLAHLRQPELPPPHLPEGDTSMSVFPCPACGAKLKAGAEQAGKRVKCPQCGTPVRVPEGAPTRLASAAAPLYVLGLCVGVGLLLALLGVRLFRPHKPPLEETSRPGSFLEMTVGNRAIAGVDDAGFYHDEANDFGPFRWTDGKARLIIPLASEERPQALLVQLQRPKDTWVRITANERELANEPVTERDIHIWEKTLDLSGLQARDRVVVEIASNTVQPQGDSRAIGVKVRGVKLLRTYVAPLGVREVSGVAEEGFHGPESYGQARQPCRWTNGAARLTVPLRGQKPRALALSAFIPDRPPDFRVRATVNGKILFDDQVQPPRPPSIWTCELPLSGIDLGESLHIELDSSTVVPAEVDRNSKDDRKLGIRLLRLSLLAD